MQLKHVLKCSRCGSESREFDLVNSEVIRCQKCGFENYEWCFKRGSGRRRS